MPFGFHPAYLIVLLIIVLIIFGPGKLPDLGNAVGKSIREFRKASSEIQDQIKEAVDKPETHDSAPTGVSSSNNSVSEPARAEAAKTDQEAKS